MAAAPPLAGRPGFSPFTRRQFVAGALAAGALAGVPPALTAWGSENGKPKRKPRIQKRTLFFNLAHEAESDTAAYYLVGGGTRVRLRRIADHPHVLKHHRKKNAFLRGVPDEALTHFVENVALAADAVTAVYVMQNPDLTSGTWNMSAMYFHLPTTAIITAFQRAVARFGPGPLPLSTKRKLYGHPPATTAQDLLEETALLDTSDHAIAIIGMHPDLLSAEPNSAATVQTTYIGPNGFALELSVLLQVLGPATPQQTPRQPNPGGWATLTPILQDSGQPFRNQRGNNRGLIQYHPDWNSAIVSPARSAVRGVVGPVKNDTTLGGDVTGLDPSAPNGPINGALWKRHDGVTTVDQSLTAGSAVQDTLKYTLTTQHTESGYSCTGSATTQLNGSVVANLTFTNWYVRWLGIYLLFLDSGGHPISPTGVQIQLPSDYDPGDSSRASLQQFAALFGLLLGPEFTILGIPVEAATATMSVNIPPAASSLRIFASGPSLLILGGVDPNDPTTWGGLVPGNALHRAAQLRADHAADGGGGGGGSPGRAEGRASPCRLPRRRRDEPPQRRLPQPGLQ